MNVAAEQRRLKKALEDMRKYRAKGLHSKADAAEETAKEAEALLYENNLQRRG